MGQSEASPALTYVPATATGNAELLTTPVGNPRDRCGMALSVITALDKTVFTYVALELSYPTTLYYDLRAITTVFQDQRPIKTTTEAGSECVARILEVPAIAMDDYTIETKEYARAVFSNAGFQNPLRFAEGSCFGESSNCEIVPLAGPEKVSDAAILLGTTGADQSSVPQNPDYWLKGLDRDSAESILDALLTRGTRDDAYMVSIIRTLAPLREFPADLIILNMKELARHETPKVRQAACAVLKRFKQPCPKREGMRVSAKPQPPPNPPQPATSRDPLADVAIPRYSIYSHFLRMMHLLVASGHRIDRENWPFRTGRLDKTGLQAVLAVANSLALQIAEVDHRASAITLGFRNRANGQLRRNKPIPDAPLEIYTLEALRTAIQVQHMKALQSAIGPQGTTRLEAFLGYEFVSGGSYGMVLAKGNQPPLDR